MKIQCDSLKYVTLLESKGISHKSAKACFEVLTDMEIQNIYSVNEVNSMLNEAINKVFEDRDKMFEQRDKMLEQRDLRLAEQKREFDENLRLQRQEMLESRKISIRASRRGAKWANLRTIFVHKRPFWGRRHRRHRRL